MKRRAALTLAALLTLAGCAQSPAEKVAMAGTDCGLTADQYRDGTNDVLMLKRGDDLDCVLDALGTTDGIRNMIYDYKRPGSIEHSDIRYSWPNETLVLVYAR
ncbi:hypothetical protein MHY20_10035 [Helcobacillus sp. ACRRO]|uniref:hypothetical protein n=1 Tax=Helcobacillus TaxID=1161125 RepID=UPI001EF56E24|nr:MULTISPECIES: hypothetical protein [Helcobacillus]MCG7427940.1 hypothetical protein [Helcobacillus sp. ACRRO]MDK7741641.1 hypothetical protein [Helcobacillus massiliensis]WOO92685.1 hypothetical protein R3I40_09760 [Helcobacillus massiliensis]